MQRSLAVTAHRFKHGPENSPQCLQFEISGRRWNRSAGRGVVQVVGRSRAVCGALVAALVVLSGCASADGEEETPPTTTTSAAAPEDSGNPWDLPVAQRPALFDPCAEIPVEAVEGVVGTPVDSAENLRNHDQGELFSCGWKNDEILFGVAGTWRARHEFLSDRAFEAIDNQSMVAGRPGIRARDRGDQFDTTCYQVFFTSRGAVVLNINLIDSLGTFQDVQFAEACEVLDEVIEPILDYIPEGDFV
ncbi:DUF3558 domain-containing protein [Dietzia maris]|nr:DUF3558 domain-containing protein [Dietzia maris]